MEMLVFGLTGRCLKDISGAKGHRFDRAAPGGGPQMPWREFAPAPRSPDAMIGMGMGD